MMGNLNPKEKDNCHGVHSNSVAGDIGCDLSASIPEGNDRSRSEKLELKSVIASLMQRNGKH